MPFDPDNPPEKVSKLSAKKQRQWAHVFNSCFEEHGDDALCHKMAWGTVKKSSVDWDEMNRRQQKRRDPDGIATDEEAARSLFMAFVDIEAADRVAMGY